MFEKQNIQETISKLNSDTVKGLTEGEAFRRLRQNGRNEMRAARKKTKIQLFLEQLKDPLIYILLIAAVVSILLGEVSDALIIGTVVLVNALVGMLIFEIETEEIYSADYFGCVPVSNPADLSDDNALYDRAIYGSGRCFRWTI